MTDTRIRLGSILLYKGGGLAFNVLSRLLWVFERWWDRECWHMAIVVAEDRHHWYVLEAVGTGVRMVPLEQSQGFDRGYRVYNWLDEFDTVRAGRFVSARVGCNYDVLVYFGTSLAYLARRAWGRPVPRLLDNAYSCWELVYAFCEQMGKPLAESYDFPLITDFLKTVEGRVR